MLDECTRFKKTEKKKNSFDTYLCLTNAPLGLYYLSILKVHCQCFGSHNEWVCLSNPELYGIQYVYNVCL